MSHGVIVIQNITRKSNAQKTRYGKNYKRENVNKNTQNGFDEPEMMSGNVYGVKRMNVKVHNGGMK